MSRYVLALSLAASVVGVARGDSLLGITQDLRLFDIDTANGATSNPRTITGMSGQTGCGITYGATSSDVFSLTTFGLDGANSLYRIDPNTGAATLVGPTGLSEISEGDIRYNRSNGLLYGLQDRPTLQEYRMFTIDSNTGAAGTILLSGGAFHDLSGLAFDGNDALILDEDYSNDGAGRIFRVDPTTGAVIDSVLLDVKLSFGGGIEFGNDGKLYLIDANTSTSVGLRTVDLSTGATTPIRTDMGGLNFYGIASIPTPGAGALLALAGIGGTRRRRA